MISAARGYRPVACGTPPVPAAARAAVREARQRRQPNITVRVSSASRRRCTCARCVVSGSNQRAGRMQRAAPPTSVPDARTELPIILTAEQSSDLIHYATNRELLEIAAYLPIRQLASGGRRPKKHPVRFPSCCKRR